MTDSEEYKILHKDWEHLTAEVRELELENKYLQTEIYELRKKNALYELERKNKETRVDMAVIPDDLLLEGNGISFDDGGKLEDSHPIGHILSVASHSAQPHIIVSGGADKRICVHDWNATRPCRLAKPNFIDSQIAIGDAWETGTKQHIKLLCVYEASAPVLDIKFHSKHAFYFLAGFMDATHGVFFIQKPMAEEDEWNIIPVRLFHDHTRPGSIRLCWNDAGDKYSSGSQDMTLRMYGCENMIPDTELPSQRYSEAISSLKCTNIKAFYLIGVVEAISFLPEIAGDGSLTDTELLVASVRDDAHLHYVNSQTLERTRINMNKDGITHCSYTILDLQLSPSKRYLLAATDKDRLFIFKPMSNVVLREFYGHVSSPYCQARCAWLPCEKYVLANSENMGTVFFWSVASQRIVEAHNVHKSKIRDLNIVVDTQVYLLTVSFDKTIKVSHIHVE